MKAPLRSLRSAADAHAFVRHRSGPPDARARDDLDEATTAFFKLPGGGAERAVQRSEPAARSLRAPLQAGKRRPKRPHAVRLPLDGPSPLHTLLERLQEESERRREGARTSQSPEAAATVVEAVAPDVPSGPSSAAAPALDRAPRPRPKAPSQAPLWQRARRHLRLAKLGAVGGAALCLGVVLGLMLWQRPSTAGAMSGTATASLGPRADAPLAPSAPVDAPSNVATNADEQPLGRSATARSPSPPAPAAPPRGGPPTPTPAPPTAPATAPSVPPPSAESATGAARAADALLSGHAAEARRLYEQLARADATAPVYPFIARALAPQAEGAPDESP